MSDQQKQQSFKALHPFNDRKSEAGRINAKYGPERVPCIVEKLEKSGIANIDKKKYLVPADLCYGQFLHVIRKRLKLQPDQAIFLFCCNHLPPASMLLSQVYKQYADEDGFLYIQYASESTFG